MIGRRQQNGLTFIEVLVSLTILATVIGAAFSLMIGHHRVYIEQGRRMEMTGNARGGTELLTRELAMVGYSPVQPYPFDSTLPPGTRFQLLHPPLSFPDPSNLNGHFQLLSDVDASGDIGGVEELIEYRFDETSGILFRQPDTSGDGEINSDDEPADPVAAGILGFEIDFRPALTALSTTVNAGDFVLPVSSSEGFVISQPIWISDATGTKIYPGLASIDHEASSLTITSPNGLSQNFSAGAIVAQIDSALIAITTGSDDKIWSGDGAPVQFEIQMEGLLRNDIR